MQQQNHPSHLALPRKQHGIVMRAVEQWRKNGVIDEQTSTRLVAATSVVPFDWQKTARYSFIVAIFCIVNAVGAVLLDDVLLRLLAHIFNAPAAMKCVFFAALAAMIFWFGLWSRNKQPQLIYSNEALFFLGVLALAGAIGYFGIAVDTGSDRYQDLFLLATVLYALLGLWFPSKLVWVFALVSLSSWMGAETAYVSGWGGYYLGMNFPLRFVLFGAVLTALGLFGQHLPRSTHSAAFQARLLGMSPQNKVMGLLHLFIALWLMSIFGNYDDVRLWRDAVTYELFFWSLLFGAVAIAAVWYGLKRDDGVLRGFGLTFLFINLYTRYFEYFWGSLHKAAFFSILAVSFWYIGSRAQTIWQIGERKLQIDKDDKPMTEGV